MLLVACPPCNLHCLADAALSHQVVDCCLHLRGGHRAIDHDGSELRAPRTRVRRALGFRRTNRSRGNLGHETALSHFGESLLHLAILEAVKPDDRHARPRCKPGRSAILRALGGTANRVKERIKRSHLIVHRDAKRLEGLRRWVHSRSVRPGAVGLPNEFRKLRRRLDRRNCARSSNFGCDLAGERLLAEAPEELGEIALAFTAASSKADQAAIAKLFSEHGRDGFVAAWLKHRGLSWAADLIPTLNLPEIDL